ncbi:MAG: recombinase family protein [Colwellia sp.]|nr:recombinase family protein [Colwellia sp.]
MKAIGYIRVSTQGQVDEGVSLEQQQAKIEAWCHANDYELVTVFQDAGLSGKALTGRTGLADALEATQKGFALITYSMSRISRSVRDMLDIGDKLKKKGADLVSLTEKIDTTSAAGKMIFNMLAVMNQFERDQISERTKAALAHKKSKGERIGTVPYGYSCIDGTSLVSNPDEQAILNDINKLRQSGYKLREIAEQLNKDGLVTRRGSQWKVQTVHNLLKAA